MDDVSVFYSADLAGREKDAMSMLKVFQDEFQPLEASHELPEFDIMKFLDLRLFFFFRDRTPAGAMSLVRRSHCCSSCWGTRS